MLKLFWNMAGQVVMVLAFVLLVAFVASITLTLAKFSEALSDTASARYDVHAADVRNTIETGINLGLELSEIAGNVAIVVRNRLALDPGIKQMRVTAADGSIVYASGRPDATEETTLADLLAQRSLPVRNSFGGTEGTVTVIYATGAHRDVIREAARTLIRDVLLITAAAATVTTAACLLLMTPLMRSLTRARDLLTAAAAAADAAVPDTGPETHADIALLPAQDTRIEATARRAAQASRATLADIARIDATLPTGPKGPAP